MRRIARALISAALLASFLSPISATAVSTNPTPVCAGATCTVTFSYTGDYYQWTAPFAGTFTFEVWGAQGGNAGYNGTSLSAGANGGYAAGTKSLTSGQIIYVYVGGQGAGQSSTTTLDTLSGGFNGGGNGQNGTSTSDYRAAGGGGATDIRVINTSVANRVIVAGGGGGGALCSCYGVNSPGVGGGVSGGDGSTVNYNASYSYNGKGGTSSAGGAGGTNGGNAGTGTLGSGGNGTNSSHTYGSSGGGGGYWGGGGAGVGMGAGGGSGYVGGVSSTTLTAGNATMPNPSGGTMTGNTGNGVARITYDNAPTPTTFSTAQTTPTNTSSSISYSLTLSQNVNTVANSDFANAGTATGCVFSISAASGTTFTLTISSCSEGTLIPKLLANSVYGTVTSATGPASDALTTTPITIDRTAPTISSVTAPGNSTYIPGNTMSFTVAFTESITVTGSPRFTLTVGTLTKYATYAMMSDSKTALFRYTVGTNASEVDTDGIAFTNSNMDLNSGSISDLASNTLSVLSFTPPTTTGIVIAQVPSAPTISTITSASQQLSVAFTAGSSQGATISNYEYSTDNGATWKSRATGTTASPLVITTISGSTTALTNGTSYTVRIRAVNVAGSGDSSTAVSATPSAVVVSGDATLVTTYGQAASTTTYTATGGTGGYTYTLSSTPSGVSISAGVVTAGATTAAGTYTQNVQATDSSSQVGLKQLVITVNKATTSITIALPNSATSAALGGAITITATVPRAGAVNFKLGGSTISGCGSASAASTTATCSWTPGSLGSVALTAIFTPTDSSNFESSTTTTLSITVVNGVSSITLSLTGGVTQAPKGQTINIIAAIDQAGKVTFSIDGKRLPGCISKSGTVGNVTCSWKPAVQKMVTISATLTPTNSVYNASTAKLPVWVIRRSGTR